MTFTSPFNHWKVGVMEKFTHLLNFNRDHYLIDCLGFNMCHVRLLAHQHAIVIRTDLSAFQTKLASISEDIWALCMRPNCPGLRPNVYHSATLSLAHSSSLIDFPLLCHCVGLFKHTFHDVWPHNVCNRTARV